MALNDVTMKIWEKGRDRFIEWSLDKYRDECFSGVTIAPTMSGPMRRDKKVGRLVVKARDFAHGLAEKHGYTGSDVETLIHLALYYADGFQKAEDHAQKSGEYATRSFEVAFDPRTDTGSLSPFQFWQSTENLVVACLREHTYKVDEQRQKMLQNITGVSNQVYEVIANTWSGQRLVDFVMNNPYYGSNIKTLALLSNIQN